jgi:cell division septal protein FtsQ
MNPEVARLRRQSAQRKYRKHMRYVRLLWSVVGVLLGILMLEVGLAICTSPRFWIHRITVEGAETLSDHDVIRLVNLRNPHSNFYLTSKRLLASRVAREPRVHDAAVRWGEIGELVVALHERQAVCRLGFTDPPRYLDAEGKLFTRTPAPSTPVPVVEGLPPAVLSVDFGQTVNQPEARAVLETLAALRAKANETVIEVTRVKLGARGTLTLVLRPGTRVFLGQPDNLPVKMQAMHEVILRASVAGYPLDDLDYIDVRVLTKLTDLGAVYKPKVTPDVPPQPGQGMSPL